MNLKVIETIETIWELPDNFFDDKDYNEEDLYNFSDCEIASIYKQGQKISDEENTGIQIEWVNY